MRIWIINQHAVPPSMPGGTRHYSIAKALQRCGHEVFVVAANYNHNAFQQVNTSGQANIAEHDEVKFGWIKVPSYQANNLARVYNLLAFPTNTFASLLRQAPFQPDLIIGSSPPLFTAAAAWQLATQFDVPLVLEARDIWPQGLVQLGHLSEHNPVSFGLRLLETYLFKRAQAVICCLDDHQNYFKQFNIKREQYFYLPNFADPNLIARQNSNELAAKAEHFTAIYAGSLNKANNVETIIDAANIIQQQDLPNPIHFKILGNGACRDGITAKIKQYNLNNVSLQQPVSKYAVYQELMNSDLALSLRLKQDLIRTTSSIKVPDYLLAGKPILFCGRNPKDIAGSAEVGPVVEAENPQALADELIALADDAKRLNYYQQQAQQFIAANHNIDIYQQPLANFLEKIHAA